MLDLSKSTYVGRFIPKDKFYTKTSISNKLRQIFTDEIEKVVWQNKIAPDTLNITCKDYKELQIFSLTLKKPNINQTILKHIDTYIPYPILYILNYSGMQKAVISFKESAARTENQMNVDSYYETGWEKELNLEMKGRSVDEIYKNFLFQISPKLNSTKQVDIKEAVSANKATQAMQKQIDVINKQIKSEPSIAKKQELARQRHLLEIGL